MSEQEITTILGPTASFDGKLTFEGALRVDGRFRGEIHTEGTLIVGERAVVEAQIVAGDVIAHGQITGDVVASRTMEIRSSARVRGNLKVGSLSIERGSVFEGQCAMGNESPQSLSHGESSAAE